MIKFEYQYGENSPLVTMILHRDSTLDDVLEEFESFLHMAGYPIDGVLDIVQEDGPDVTVN